MLAQIHAVYHIDLLRWVWSYLSVWAGNTNHPGGRCKQGELSADEGMKIRYERMKPLTHPISSLFTHSHSLYAPPEPPHTPYMPPLNPLTHPI
jgi:hypothetical protein